MITSILSKADRERLKQASRELLASLRELLRSMHDWTQSTATQSEVKIQIVDNLYQMLPKPPFTEEETEAAAERVYDYVWQQSLSGPTWRRRSVPWERRHPCRPSYQNQS